MTSEPGRLSSDSIGITHIICFVIATAGPLVSLVGSTPAVLALGNGAGLPGTYLIVASVYALFSVGFTAMGRYVTDAGAFYAYITRGLGAAWGNAGAMVAILAYSAVQLATYALFGIFGGQCLVAMGIAAPPWWSLAIAALVLVHILGQRTILFSGRVLLVLLLAEVSILVLLDGGVMVTVPPRPDMLHGFMPDAVFAPGMGTTLAFVVPCFLGFEATAIFGEEARNPTRTIPLATYGAVLVIGVLYAVSSWAVLTAFQGQEPRSIAATHGAMLVFDAAGKILGKWAVAAMMALMMTSMFAALLALHNTIARYFFSLGRSRVLPVTLAATHHLHGSPTTAGRAQSVIAATIIAACAILRIDPYNGVFAWSAALASISILSVQCAASLAVCRFHLANPGLLNALKGLGAPILAAAGLGGFVALLTVNLHVIAGTTSSWVWLLPAVAIGVGVCGLLTSRRHPSPYQREIA